MEEQGRSDEFQNYDFRNYIEAERKDWEDGEANSNHCPAHQSAGVANLRRRVFYGAQLFGPTGS
jgi:hypothetical protein